MTHIIQEKEVIISQDYKLQFGTLLLGNAEYSSKDK
jgi:hypothetical protein